MSADAERLRRAVRETVARWLRVELAPPADTLATRWIDVVQGWQRLQLVIGVLWLPAQRPRAPRDVTVTISDTWRRPPRSPPAGPARAGCAARSRRASCASSATRAA
ncbi:uncharacterized protein SOCEGT47_077650 [Sorangium cellulosum]|uniref:Uncharacterized protein n=1 Tax=Sorangium cellulosum TaxID=56 RepID=A0A4P2QBU1_SORCE|nr:hypothetical protein [Sorangium cellulosum]AUX27184.1 uncharacterized protein SOCEGT47_077650 [Sorangium cellulosum]